MEIRIGRVFRMLHRCGSGSFGQVWEGVDIITGRKVAIKLESLKKGSHHILLEAKIYNLLRNAIGIPSIFWYGCEGDYAVLVMELLGPSLEDLCILYKKKLNLSTVSNIGVQIIDRMETIHNAGIIHRDIKPQNFLIGAGRAFRIIYAIDFGLAKSYKHAETGIHIPYKEGKGLTGTVRYASVSTHLGVEQSRRDDIEAVGYVLLNLIRGELPWQGLKAESKKDKYTRIGIKKITTPLPILCKGLPQELIIFFQYARSLKFVQRPDYEFLRSCLRSLFYHDSEFINLISETSTWTTEERYKRLQQLELALHKFEWERKPPDSLENLLGKNKRKKEDYDDTEFVPMDDKEKTDREQIAYGLKRTDGDDDDNEKADSMKDLGSEKSAHQDMVDGTMSTLELQMDTEGGSSGGTGVSPTDNTDTEIPGTTRSTFDEKRKSKTS